MAQKARIIVPILGVILIALTLYYLFAPRPYEDESLSTVSSTNPQDILVEEWKEYRPQNGMFVVRLPALPQHASESVPIPDANDSIKYNMYLSQSPAGSTFLINIIQYPPAFDTSNSDALLEGIVKEMMSGNTSNKLISQTKGLFLNHPAVDFTLHTQSGELFAKVFLIGNTVYILSVIDPNTERGQIAFNRFVEGFLLIEEALGVKI